MIESTAQPSLGPQPLPVARRLPLVGSLPEVLFGPADYLINARRVNGDIYLLNMGVEKLVVLNHPRHIEHVFVSNSSNYRKSGALWDAMRTLLGNGLAVSQGETWERQRGLVRPQFRRDRLIGVVPLMVEAVENELERWVSLSEAAESVDVLPLLGELTMKLLVKTVFGTSMSHESIERIRPEIMYAIKYLVPAMLTNSLPSWVPRPGARRYALALRRIDEILFEVIDQRRRDEDGGDDLLSMLLNAGHGESGDAMSPRQLRDETLTLFLAGYETTSVSLAWAAHYLSQDAAIQERLYGEVSSVLEGSAPNFSDLNNLTYARNVMMESLRICPPIWWNPREAIEEDVIDGFKIPKGSNVAPLTYVVHHHPDFWVEPERFDPDRFSESQSSGRHRYAWHPFGVGPRKCIGTAFALMESQIVLAMILQRFKLGLVPGRTATKAMLGTLRPKNGVHVELRPRSGSGTAAAGN